MLGSSAAWLALSLMFLDLPTTRTLLHAEFRGTNWAGLLVLRRKPWVMESGVDGHPIPVHAAVRVLIDTTTYLPGQRGH